MSARIADPDDASAVPAADAVRIPDVLSNAVAYALRRAQEASFAAYLQRVGNPDLKPGRYTILMLLAEYPGLTPSELSALCGRDRSTLTATLRALDEQGLIERKRRSEDQRSYGVRLTSAGNAVLAQLRMIARAHDARLDAIVGEDKAVFLAVLRRLAEQLGVEEDQQADHQKRRIG